jgi:hypothetical protein
VRTYCLNNSKLEKILKEYPELIKSFQNEEGNFNFEDFEKFSLSPALINVCATLLPGAQIPDSSILKLSHLKLLKQGRDLWPDVQRGQPSAPMPLKFKQAADAMQDEFRIFWRVMNFVLPAASEHRIKLAQKIVAASNEVLSKKGHTQNLHLGLRKFFENHAAEFTKELSEFSKKSQQEKILEAAKYTNLCDSSPQIPVSIMAGKGSFEEVKPLLPKRAGISADLFKEFKLGDTEVEAIIRQHKGAPSMSISAQLMYLMDSKLGMAAKPFFQKNPAKLIEGLEKDIAKDRVQIDPELLTLVKTDIEKNGVVFDSDLILRDIDLYVR